MEQLTVRGDAFERGLMQGRHFGAGALRQATERLTQLPMLGRSVPAWARGAFIDALVSGAGRFYLSRHGQRLRSHEGGKFDRALAGLAHGLGVSPARLYGFLSFEVASARFTF